MSDLYASAADLVSLCEAVEQVARLQYAYTRTYPSLPIPVFSTCRHIPHFGYAKVGNMFTAGHGFVILRAEDEIVPYRLERKDGSPIFNLDAGHQRDPVHLLAGGTFGESTIIQSTIFAGPHKITEGSLFSLFKKELTKTWTRVDRSWVAPEALALLRRGGRLTQSMKLPANLNLSEPSTE